MGVPKFYRWLSERYPRINQLLDEENLNIDLQIDHLYLDMNGVIHLCTHPNSDEAITVPTDEEIYANLESYLDRVISKVIRPRKSIYFAVDGVAPRAKLNQQRGRRFCSGRARVETLKFLHQSVEVDEIFDTNCITPGTEFMQRVDTLLQNYIESRVLNNPSWSGLEIYYSGHLVPGEGEHKIMQHIRQQRNKKSYRPNQRHCLVGQDADLIMLGLATHEPHFTLLRDVVLFGKPKKSPEVIHLTKTNKDSTSTSSSSSSSSSQPAVFLDSDAHDAISLPQSFLLADKPLQLLHLSVLREYIEVEFSYDRTGPPHDRERLIDDFILLTFLVGNDFLPHLPSLDISESAFDVIFDAYRQLHSSSSSSSSSQELKYIVENGKIKNYEMLENLFKTIGKKEEMLMKKRDILLRSKLYTRPDEAGDTELFVPSNVDDDQSPVDSQIINQEALMPMTSPGDLRVGDARYGESLLLGLPEEGSDSTNSSIGVTGEEIAVIEEPPPLDEDGFIDKSVIKSIETSTLLIDTGRVGPAYPGVTRTGEKVFGTPGTADPDFSYRDHHYRYKFGIIPSEPSSKPFLEELSQQYLRGLVWCLSYYTSGCVSWEWYYPYHYGPLLTDVTNIKSILPHIKFQLGAPFTPFQQLLGCLPPTSSYLLPKPYQWLMSDPLSPLHHVYPTEFVEDMDGKRNPWEAVTILPFIDANEILNAEKIHVPVTALTPLEIQRNHFTQNMIFRSHAKTMNKFLVDFNIRPTSPFVATLIPGTYIPFFGFPSLRSLPISGVTAKILPSKMNRLYRYKSLILQVYSRFNPTVPLHTLINRTVYVHYPLMQEALVIGIGTLNFELRHADYLNHKTTYGLNATKESFPLAEDNKIIQMIRTEEEMESWAISSIKLRRNQLLGGLGSSGLEIGKIKTRVIVVPVVRRVKDKLTGDIQRIYGAVPFDLPLQLVRWSHPAAYYDGTIPQEQSTNLPTTSSPSSSSSSSSSSLSSPASAAAPASTIPPISRSNNFNPTHKIQQRQLSMTGRIVPRNSFQRGLIGLIKMIK